MLRIRLSRTGRKNYPSYRIVVAEHARPVKGKFIEILGHYIPNRDPKVFEYDEKKIREWISKGAKPTDTVASLLKNAGVTGMEKYIEPRDKKRKKKKEVEEAPAAPTPAPAAEEPKAEEAPAPAEEPKAEEPAPAAEEPKAEEKKEEPAPEEAPKAEEEPTPTEETKKEEEEGK